MAITRPIPKVYDFVGSKRAELSSAYNIVETKEFGQINTLTFKYSYYLIDANGNTVYDENGLPQDDPRTGTIINEFLVEFNDDWYIIKNVEEGRKTDGTKFIEVSCNAKADELTFKQIRYINLTPPIHAPVDAKQAILEVITYPFQADLGYGKITAVSGNVVTLGVTTTFDFTGYKIVTLEGTGKYQQRKIVSYNTGTKQATLDLAFSPQVNTTTVFRVHNSKYVLGYVDPFLINDGAFDIFRALKFEDVTVMDALRTISTRFTGFLKFNTTFGGTFNEFNTAIDLRLPNLYNNFEFRYKKNLKGVRRIIDSTAGCFTRLYPEGRNNLSIASVATKTRTDSSITYNEHVLGKGDLFNFQYFMALGYSEAQCRDLFIRDFRFIEDAYTTPDALYDGAKKALEEISLPSITYEVEGVDLSVIGVNTSTFGIGDTVQVVDTDLGFDFRATVVSKEIDYDTPFAPRIVLSNFTDKFGDLLFKLLKYQEGFTNRKALYGKTVSIVIADEGTSRNWRYADYIVPADGSITADYVINAAITEVSELGGGEVVLLDGVYEQNNTIVLKDNVTLTGVGVASRLIPSKSGISLAITASARKNITVRNVFIDYARQSDGTSLKYEFNNGIGIYTGSDNILIKEIIQEYVMNNMFISIGCSNIVVESSVFKSDNITFAGSDVVDLKACTNANVKNNTFIGKLAPFISIVRIADEIGLASGNFFVDGNYIYATDPSNVYSCSGVVSGLFEITSANALVKITNNKILYEGSGYYNLIRSTTPKIEIVNNILDGWFVGDGISIGGNNSKILNNTIRGSSPCSTTAGIRITSNDCDVQGNTVRRGNTFGTVYSDLTRGIRIDSTANRTIVANNDLYLSGTVDSLSNAGVGTILLGGNKL